MEDGTESAFCTTETTEIVVIPHPTELAKLTALQHELLSALQAQSALSGAIWRPALPLYVRALTIAEGSAPEATASALARLRTATQCECVLETLALSAGVMSARATLQGADFSLLGTLALAQQLNGSGAPAGDVTATAAYSALSLSLPPLLPLRLPVFRVAEVHFTYAPHACSWEVVESHWCKAKK